VETERAAVIPPQSLGDLSGSRLHIAIRRAPLLRLAYLSESPLRTSAVWVERSRRVVRKPPRGVRVAGTRRPFSDGHFSLRLRPASEYDPSSRAPSCTLSRGFRSPSATQPSRSTTPRLSPTWVTLRPHAYHASRRFPPSTASLVLLSTRCAHGILALQSLT